MRLPNLGGVVNRTTGPVTAAFLFILLFIAAGLIYSSEGMRPLLLQLESDSDWRLEKSLLVNRMVNAGNRRGLALLRLQSSADLFERDELLMEIYALGGEFAAAREAMVALPLDERELELLNDQSRLVGVLLPMINQVMAQLSEGEMEKGRDLLLHEILPLQGKMLNSLSLLGSYQQSQQNIHIEQLKVSVQSYQWRVVLAGLVVVGLVVMTAVVVLRLLLQEARRRQRVLVLLEQSNQKLSESLQELTETSQFNTDRQYALDQSALVLMTAPNGEIIYVNDLFCAISGYPRERIIGAQAEIFSSGYHDLSFWSQFWQEISAGHVVRREICNHTSSGEEFWISSTVTPLMDLDRPRGYLSISFDVTDRKRMEDELQQSHRAWRQEMEQRRSEVSRMAFLASHDTLTQLPNQTVMMDRISHTIKRSRDASDHTFFSLLLVDLFNFRDLNEGFGREIGDQLLTQVTSRLKKILSPSETVARIGGKKFAILREDVESAEDNSALIELLQGRLESPFRVGERELRLKITVGVVLYPDDGDTVDTLMENLFAALKQARKQGGLYSYYKRELNERAHHYALMMNELRGAVDRGQLELYYQPKVSLREGKIEGAEALIRWNHPRRGVVKPLEFIPLLESSGVIHEVGDWVLERACQQARHWIEKQGRPFRIAVNITVEQLQSENFVATVTKILQRTGLSPDSLELEITESHYMDRLDLSVSHLVTLRNLGVRVAIDDFGTGHSSLAYLLHLPVDTLKIDKCFVDRIPHNRQDLFLVEIIMSIGERLGLEVVAEGVEQSEQVSWLLENGCDLVQGYYFSPPLSADKFKTWMSEEIDPMVRLT